MKPYKNVAFLPLIIVATGLMASGCTAMIGQTQIETDVQPLMSDQTTDVRQIIINTEMVATISVQPDEFSGYVPVEPIVEALGGTYIWDKVAQTVIVEQPEDVVTTFKVDNVNVIRNRYPLRIRESPQIIDDEIWLPGSAISRMFDVDYADWDQSGQIYRIYRFPEPDQLQTDLEYAAIAAVQQHLQDQEIELVRSPSELPQSPQNIVIKSVQQLSEVETVNDGLVKVVVSFSTNYQPVPEETWLFSQSGETQYERSYFLRFREGESELELISERLDRTGLGVPIPFLDESEFSSNC